MKRLFSTVLGLLFAAANFVRPILDIIGLGGVADDLRWWRGTISDWWTWILPFVGLGIIVWANWDALKSRLLLPKEESYVTVEEAGRWLYERLSESGKDMLRSMGRAKGLFDSMDEATATWVKQAAYEGACPIFGRVAEGYPLEPVTKESAEMGAFEQVFGSEDRKAFDLSVRRSDLPRILEYWRKCGA